MSLSEDEFNIINPNYSRSVQSWLYSINHPQRQITKFLAYRDLIC
jgi:hypothetical protein